MDLLELIETIVKSFVHYEESVSVSEVSNDSSAIHVMIKVHEDDMARVIGKEGRVINALRTLIQEASSLRDNKYIKIEIEKF